MFKQIISAVSCSSIFWMSCTPTEIVPDTVISDDYDVVIDGKIEASTGFGMGVDDGDQLRTWTKEETGYLAFNYPGNLGWGAVFITVGGDPKQPPRPFIDISSCQKLSIEMKGKNGNEVINIGIKDKSDPDNGTETKKSVSLTSEWKIYEFNLTDFKTCNLKELYVVTEFVFPGNTADSSTTVYLKNIRFLK
jgi:hypothetical protein